MKPIELPDMLADEITAAASDGIDAATAVALISKVADLIENQPPLTVEWALQAPGSDRPFERTWANEDDIPPGVPLDKVFRYVLGWHHPEVAS